MPHGNSLFVHNTCQPMMVCMAIEPCTEWLNQTVRHTSVSTYVQAQPISCRFVVLISWFSVLVGRWSAEQLHVEDLGKFGCRHSVLRIATLGVQSNTRIDSMITRRLVRHQSTLPKFKPSAGPNPPLKNGTVVPLLVSSPSPHRRCPKSNLQARAKAASSASRTPRWTASICRMARSLRVHLQ